MSEHEIAEKLLPVSYFTDCNVVLFEDGATQEELFPMAVLRPSWEIRCGAGCLRQWFGHLEADGMTLLMRPRKEMLPLAEQLVNREDDSFDPNTDTVFVNGRLIGLWKSEELAEELPDTIVDADGRLLLAKRDGEQVRKLLALSGTEIATQLVQGIKGSLLPQGWTVKYARYVWDYMLHNGAVLRRQLSTDVLARNELLGAHAMRDFPPGVMTAHRTAGHPIFVTAGARIMSGVVFGNHAGPIWIGAQTEIEPHCYLEGPLYIGAHCRIKAGTRFYNGNSLGDHCRVAGEISGSVLQSFVNKQHEGFLGNSLLGSWTNLGADTRNSNLKNDYSQVKVQVGSRLVETKEQYIGLLCGDHTKTGINTMFNTGTVVGVGANVYGAGYPPRFIGSFQWGGVEGMKAGSLERTLEAARIAMPRREQTLTEAEVELLRRHYEETVHPEKSL